jgi:hypothetical protein
MTPEDAVTELIEEARIHAEVSDPDVAHLIIDGNEVVSSHLLPGLAVRTREKPDGVEVDLTVREGAVIRRAVHLCFGVTHARAVQHIVMHVHVGKGASIAVRSHCVFPKAQNIKHVMDADIVVDEDAAYEYRERHIHGEEGSIEVRPTATVDLKRNARFTTEFELLRGRVGVMAIDYTATCRESSTLEMVTKISGKGDDRITVRETGHLVGERARGVLTSRIAVRGRAKADVYNKLVATAPYARGHVDCHEIVQDAGTANAVPIVEVRHPKAHVTHEAAIGSVDSKQLATLMARGLSEERAVELIIEGLLR